MFGEKALELIKELYRTKGGNVTNYNVSIQSVVAMSDKIGNCMAGA